MVFQGPALEALIEALQNLQQAQEILEQAQQVCMHTTLTMAFLKGSV